MLFSGRKVGRRVLTADVDAELRLLTCVWNRIVQIARRSTPERSRAWVKSDSSQRCRNEVKTGGKAENSGTPWSDMVGGRDDFGETHRMYEMWRATAHIFTSVPPEDSSEPAYPMHSRDSRQVCCHQS